MDFAQLKWNILFWRSLKNPVKYDLWLDKYLPSIPACDLPVLDLGCGSGNNTKYLLERNIEVISCDYSITALKRVRKNIVGARTQIVDLRNPLPFKNQSAKCIIADLSLHYFSSKDTKSIINEIDRVLIENGLFLFRVNSVNDFDYGAGKGREIENNFYLWKGERKRFFNLSDIEYFIDKRWKVIMKEETNIDRYEKCKKAWEVGLIK